MLTIFLFKNHNINNYVIFHLFYLKIKKIKKMDVNKAKLSKSILEMKVSLSKELYIIFIIIIIIFIIL